MNLQLIRVAVVATITGSLAAQQVWKVNCNGGPGVHFTDLPPAVAAAAPGDTILVYDGLPYCAVGYSAPTINKPLRIVGFNTAYSPGNSAPSFAGLAGVVTIAGIPAGQQVLLSNFNMLHSGWPSGLVITNCAGDVLIEDLLFMNWGIAGQQLSVQNCANVVLRGCSFELAGSSLQVVDSSVLLTTSELYHVAPSGTPPFGGYAQTAEALRLTNSTATIVGSLVWGCGALGPAPMQARPGVILNNSTLRVGPASLVRGGSVDPTAQEFSYTSQQPALSAVHQDPRGTIALPPWAGPAPIAMDIHAAYHSWVIADEPFDISVAGPANGFALLVLGDMTPFPATTPWGVLAVDPVSAMLLDVVALTAANGTHEWTYHCPSSAPNAHAFAFQALTLSPLGQLGFTVPTPFTVGWEHGRIP